MPVHGEWRHLRANADLALATGVHPRGVVVVEDGVVVDLVNGKVKVAGAVECGYVYVDGSSVGEADETLLKDRRILRDEGFVSVIVVMDSSTGKIVAGPEITARGFVEDDVVFDDVMPRLTRALDDATAQGVTDTYQARAGHAPHGRWLGRPQDPPPPDDHPRRHRSLTASVTPWASPSSSAQTHQPHQPHQSHPTMLPPEGLGRVCCV